MKNIQKKLIPPLAVIVFLFASLALPAHQTSAASCQATATNYGTVTTSIVAPEQATYRLWSRIKAGSAAANSYLLNIDNAHCYTVGGGSGVSATSWTWVGYQDGNVASTIDLALTKGSHTVTFIGTQPDVALDHFIITSDLACTPQGNGDNCNVASDTTPPVTTMTVPLDGATVSGTVHIAATATDAGGISKVEYYLNSVLLTTQTVAPYAYDWNSTAAVNGAQLLTVKAYDTSGNFASDSATVTVQNGDTKPPTQPTNLTATVNAQGKVALSWAASTDNVGVASYRVTRNSALLAAAVPGTAYEDTTVAPGVQYSYQVTAVDGAGNISQPSQAATVTVPGVTDTVKPATPSGVRAAAVNASQVNLSWNAGTDNVGVVSYDVFRAKKGNSLAKIATVTSTAFGDTGLRAKTTYVYAVRARDAAGNMSDRSSSVQVTTLAAVARSVIQGTVKDTKGRPIANATILVEGQGGRAIYQADSKGKYVVRELSPGRYTVTYRARQYEPKSVTMKMADASVITKNVMLGRR